MRKVSIKKQAMEQAAIELFARKGVAGTTIKEIAAGAGVTEGALYRHFASKEAMAAALFERELLRLREMLLRAADSGKSPQEKLRSVISCLYASYEEAPYPLLFVILNFQNLQGDPELDDTAHIYDFIIDYVRGLFVSVPCALGMELLPTLAAGIIMQPILFHYYQKLPEAPLRYADDVTRGCCRMIGIDYEK